ncbi:MAG: 30S ribosomal protein S6 [Candidatus Omnitrophica bacterium]|nr:30S ribosomal protein S6 [Candidatus Omnitrophota bacterium]MBU4488231.1 30S ribosomal protein S6 [Candidatus Omnitrophota bacterium]MCG2704679.1 30S ribosomal protein S6 [Candidatus Omnitrophota bacterium]
MNKYDGIFIFKPDLSEKDVESEYSKAEEMIQKHGGKVEKTEKWGKKRTAYAVKKFHDGFFLYIFFEAPPESINVLTELFKLNVNILRVQFVKKDD